MISKLKQTSPDQSGFKIGGKTYPVTIKSYDTQSSPTRAGDLARTAILIHRRRHRHAAARPDRDGLDAAAAGAVLAISQLQVQPSAVFSVQWTAEMAFATIIGGRSDDDRASRRRLGLRRSGSA